MMTEHPIQPVIMDDHGVARFKSNPIVELLLESGPEDMNSLARLDFSNDDRAQFAQLIGYSVCGAADLGYVSDEIIEIGDFEVAYIRRDKDRRGPEEVQPPQAGLDELPDAIREFEIALPGWWLTLGFCTVSNDTTCAPQGADRGCPDHDLIEVGTPFDHGFSLDVEQPSNLAQTLRALTKIAVAARDAKRKELDDAWNAL